MKLAAALIVATACLMAALVAMGLRWAFWP
jgi:hypothetical protein